jgi:hypothetical protein
MAEDDNDEDYHDSNNKHLAKSHNIKQTTSLSNVDNFGTPLN